MAQLSTASFDAYTFELWGPLLTGARAVVLDREVLLEPAALKAALRAEGITTAFLTTALFQQTLQAEPDAFAAALQPLFRRRALRPRPGRPRLAGQAAPLRQHLRADRNRPPSPPSSRSTTADDAAGPVPIGKPIGHTEILVLDRAGQPAAIGSPGELCLAGDGLAFGYWGQPARTAEAFVPHPRSSAPGARLYRTGDLVRLLPRGDLDYLGRIDFQVKIRGFRIELGEVEAALGRQPAVRERSWWCRAKAPASGWSPSWCCSRRPPTGQAAALAEIDAALAEVLPSFALPQLFALEALPLDPNGKVDRRALPRLDARLLGGRKRRPGGAAHPLEAEVVAIFAELLGEADFGIEADFFELGGHSLLATRLVSRLREATRVELPLRQRLRGRHRRGPGRARSPRPQPVAAEPPLDARHRGRRPALLRPAADPLPPGLRPQTTAYNMPWSVEIEGRVDAGLLARALRQDGGAPRAAAHPLPARGRRGRASGSSRSRPSCSR